MRPAPCTTPSTSSKRTGRATGLTVLRAPAWTSTSSSMVLATTPVVPVGAPTWSRPALFAQGAGCTVTAQCLEFGQKHSRGYGVYGGLPGKQRQNLRRSEARLPQQRRTYCRRCSTPYTLVNGSNECRVCRGRTDRLRADDKARQQREARARKALGMSRTRASAKQAGAKFETVITNYLAIAMDDDRIERRRLSGKGDRGDIGGVRTRGQRVVVECKSVPSRIDLAGWVKESHAEAGNDGALLGVVAHKRVGRADPADQWVTMTVGDFVALLTGEHQEGRYEP
jgi:hypothetical protein